MAVIAEVKKASPSKGVIRPDFAPAAIARGYERGGAHALSVLTDTRFFQGALDHLTAVRAAVSLPVLRKDFIIDPIQVRQSAAAGADALLLIVAALSERQLAELHGAAAELGLDALVEVHTGAELDRALALKPRLIGINNRDLSTFTCDIAATLDLMKRVPARTTAVSESGIRSGAQTAALRAAGVKAVLVGESLVRLADPGPRIRELALCRSA